MWPFKQQKTDGTVAYEEHLERLRAWFGLHLSEEELLNPARTADGHRLDEMVVCYDCHQFVLKEKAKAVECRWQEPSHDRHSFLWVPVRVTRYYCQRHAPVWDIVQYDRGTSSGCCYYHRIPAVPERLEEIVEVPVRVPRSGPTPKSRKRKSTKGAN